MTDFKTKKRYYEQFAKHINKIIQQLDIFDTLQIIGIDKNESIIQDMIYQILFIKQVLLSELTKFHRYLCTLTDIYTVPERAIAYETSKKKRRPSNKPLIFKIQQELLEELRTELAETTELERLLGGSYSENDEDGNTDDDTTER